MGKEGGFRIAWKLLGKAQNINTYGFERRRAEKPDVGKASDVASDCVTLPDGALRSVQHRNLQYAAWSSGSIDTERLLRKFQ